MKAKSIFQRTLSVFLGLFMLVLAGCASNGMTKTTSVGDGDKVFASAVVRVDLLVTKTSETEGSVYELHAVQVGFKELNGDWVTYFDEKQQKMVPAISRFHRETKTTPFGREITLTFVGGVVPSIVNGEYAKQIAKATACKAGSICADNVNVNNNDLAAIATGGVGLGGGGGSAGAMNVANANAAAGQETNVNVSNGGGGKPDVPTPCKTCGGEHAK